MPVHTSRHTLRGGWRAHAAQTESPAPDFASAQTVFYVARGLAVLLAAAAIGLGAASGEAERAFAPLPAPSHATTR